MHITRLVIVLLFYLSFFYFDVCQGLMLANLLRSPARGSMIVMDRGFTSSCGLWVMHALVRGLRKGFLTCLKIKNKNSMPGNEKRYYLAFHSIQNNKQ